jgi:uncharacterized protein YcgL (UPF0745 family)
MECYIYRSEKKAGAYLFLLEKDNFSKVPEALLSLLGKTTFSFSFDLTEDRQLMQVDSKEVIRNLNENGFFLQLLEKDREKINKSNEIFTRYYSS